jgi:hypothetical protein
MTDYTLHITHYTLQITDYRFQSLTKNDIQKQTISSVQDLKQESVSRSSILGHVLLVLLFVFVFVSDGDTAFEPYTSHDLKVWKFVEGKLVGSIELLCLVQFYSALFC